MAKPQLDPARLSGVALSGWFRRTTSEVEREREQARDAQRQSFFDRSNATNQKPIRPKVAANRSPSADTAITDSPHPVFTRGSDGKLHPIEGYKTTGPMDFGTWSHNIDWSGVSKDLSDISKHALEAMFIGLAVEEFIAALGASVGQAVARAVEEAVHSHHPHPKFLGGRVDQELVRLEKSVHQKLHVELAKALKESGFLPVGGKAGSSVKWRQLFERDPDARRRAFDILLKVTGEIDREFGLSITPILRRELGL